MCVAAESTEGRSGALPLSPVQRQPVRPAACARGRRFLSSAPRQPLRRGAGAVGIVAGTPTERLH